jgi:energy-converting hydrogenase B subunit D
MTALQCLLLCLVAIGGTVVVLTRDPRRQALLVSLNGLILSLSFLALQAPDVALAELAVGSVAIPLMILIALARIERRPK